jgi:ceramide synthetase
MYLAQLAVWFYTAFSHRCLEARHKDYFVMYSHHVATLALVALSYYGGWTHIGLLILFLHDASDIVADLLKMCNYMGLDESSGTYLTEGVFALNIGTWAWLRLWEFPRRAVYSVAVEFPRGDQQPPPAGGYACLVFLCFLQCLHAWWFYLFLRIAYKIVASAENPHDAGREEYEGSSDSEPPSEDEATPRAAAKKTPAAVRKRTTRRTSD